MLSNDQLQFAIEDARERHAALVRLIDFADSQAMSLLNIYSTTGIAMASAAAAILATDSQFPAALAWALIGATGAFVVGAVFCWLTMRSVEVSLPGRGAEFWLWAMQEDVSTALVFSAYLKNLEVESNWNRSINDISAHHLLMAKLMAVLAAPVAAAAAMIGGLLVS